MKKLITSFLTLFVLFAFTSQSHAQLEARAGLVLAKIKTKFIGATVSSDSKAGAQLGITYSKPSMIN